MKRWNVKERALMTACMGTTLKVPMQVVILKTDCEGEHPIKVTDVRGNVYYCSAEELKILNNENNRINNELFKGAVRKASLPTFKEIERRFFSMYQVREQCSESADAALVIQMAEKSLFNEMRNGCRWEE